jgi:hypothetical protein
MQTGWLRIALVFAQVPSGIRTDEIGKRALAIRADVSARESLVAAAERA